MATIGFQTDLPDDPDEYIFAGGRHVGSQTVEFDLEDGLKPEQLLSPSRYPVKRMRDA